MSHWCTAGWFAKISPSLILTNVGCFMLKVIGLFIKSRHITLSATRRLRILVILPPLVLKFWTTFAFICLLIWPLLWPDRWRNRQMVKTLSIETNKKKKKRKQEQVEAKPVCRDIWRLRLCIGFIWLPMTVLDLSNNKSRRGDNTYPLKRRWKNEESYLWNLLDKGLVSFRSHHLYCRKTTLSYHDLQYDSNLAISRSQRYFMNSCIHVTKQNKSHVMLN